MRCNSWSTSGCLPRLGRHLEEGGELVGGALLGEAAHQAEHRRPGSGAGERRFAGRPRRDRVDRRLLEDDADVVVRRPQVVEGGLHRRLCVGIRPRRKGTLPKVTVSPSLARCSLMRAPLTKVPLVDPRSRTFTTSPSCSSSACSRDTVPSSTGASLCGERPTTRRRPSPSSIGAPSPAGTSCRTRITGAGMVTHAARRRNPGASPTPTLLDGHARSPHPSPFPGPSVTTSACRKSWRKFVASLANGTAAAGRPPSYSRASPRFPVAFRATWISASPRYTSGLLV